MALAISDRIVVVRDKAIAQIGTPAEIDNFPRNAFVADFVGSADLIRGRHRPECDRDGLIVLETAGGTLVYGTTHGRSVGAEGVFSVRTIHLSLSREAPASQINLWPVRIRRRVFQGDLTQYQVDWEDRQLVVRCTAADPLDEGEQAYLTVDPHRCIRLKTDRATTA